VTQLQPYASSTSTGANKEHRVRESSFRNLCQLSLVRWVPDPEESRGSDALE
jgi:hypothetical protein